MSERSFNDIAQDIIDAAPQVELLVEEWFVTLSAVNARRDLREQGLVEQLQIADKAADVAEATANEWRRELERTKEQLETADAFARVADAYCWDPETTTHDDLMNARARWQSEVGRAKLRAASSPAVIPHAAPVPASASDGMAGVAPDPAKGPT